MINSIHKFQLLYSLVMYLITLGLGHIFLHSHYPISNLIFVGVGVFVYICFIFLLKKYYNRKLAWLRTFTHEFIHVIFIYLTGNEVQHFYATKFHGGYVQYNGKKNVLISLSPYFFPIYPLLFFLIGIFLKDAYCIYLEVFIGLAYAFQLHTFYLDLQIEQTDFLDYGRTFSISFIILMNSYFMITIFHLIESTSFKSFIWFIN